MRVVRRPRAVQATADVVSSLLVSVRRLHPVTSGLRGLLVLLVLVLAALLWQGSGAPFDRLLVLVGSLALLRAVAQPSGVAPGIGWVALALRLLVHREGWAEVGVVVALVWLITCLLRASAVGPSWTVASRDALLLQLRNALAELGWLLLAGAAVATGVLVGPGLPGGGWWALAFLIVAAAVTAVAFARSAWPPQR